VKKSKLFYAIFVLCLITIMLAVSGCGSESATTGQASEAVTEAPDQVYTLKYQSSWPRTEIFSLVHEQLAKDILEASGGRLKIEVYAAGEIVDAASQLDAVKSGVLDMAAGCGSYYSSITIGNIEAGLPFSWMNSDEALVAFNRFGLLDLIKEEYAEQGVRYLGLSFEDHYCLLSTKPVNNLNDLKKMKVRLMGAFGQVGESVGISSVMVPYDEVYLALTTGMIDAGLFGGLYSYVDLGYQEIADYYVGTPWVSPLVGNFVISQKSYDKLPADLQAILDKFVDMYKFQCRQYNMYGEYANTDLFEITYFNDADIAELTKAAVDVWDVEAAKSTRNQEAIDIIKKLANATGRLD